jgi:hypothetical protein
MKKTLPITIALLSLLTVSLAFVKADDPIDKWVSRLQRWTDTIPQEKVYLHMDKPYYALGDTIWFKGYVTIGSRHQLSALSGAVYVDLINEQDSVVKALKLPVTAGMVMGDFVLIDDYKQGSYRIRAYTQWMRNAGPDYFFDRTFTVGDLLSNNLVAKADYQYKDINNKQVLTALLNFTDDEGRALGERALRYQVVINNKTVWAQNIKTDALGSARINIDNANKADLAGAYIRTTIEGPGKYPIVRDFPIKAKQVQTDVQFFPEGGSLVNGIVSKVAFKAVGVDGLGIAIKGSIIDDAGNEVTALTTLHAGMGSFMLRPVTGKTYSAKISFADATTQTIALPKAADEGYTLSVYQPGKDSVLVRINTSPTLLAQPQSLGLIAQTSGESIFASTLKIEKPVTSVWLSKKNFPGGIAQFTLFNTAGEPLNERIAFIRSDDRMQLDIKTAKATYKSKEHIKIDLDAKDGKGKATAGNFSVTVIDEGKMPVDESKESTIFSNLLLTSDLKGYVEQPNYYFTNETEEVNKALDHLMLTQGYRRFAWKELDKTTGTKPKFEVEGLGTKITGRVFTLTNKPLPNANVVLNSVIAGVTKFTTTDSLGRFKFDGIFMTDSIKFAVQGRGAKGTDKVKVILDQTPKLLINKNPNLGDVSTNITGTLKEYIDKGKKDDDIYEKLGLLDKVHRLREVRIRARKPAPPPYSNQYGYTIPPGLADQTIMMNPEDSIVSSLGAWLATQARIVVFRPLTTRDNMIVHYPWVKDITKSPPPVVPMKLILDGRKVDLDEAAEILDGYQVPPEAVYKVDVVWGTRALMASFGGPALLIYTKRGYIRKSYTPSIANITPKGFNKVREFYSPRYDKPGAGKLPDLRTTIYWNPYLKTDTNGKSAFNFFNADGPGSYKVIVEGINADGQLGRQVYRYTVDAAPVDAATPALLKADKSLAVITAPLDSFNNRLPVEKLYLHTDKPYYNIGDTVWFKAYLVNGSNLTPSKMSGLLYVELDKDTVGMVRRISIPIKDGLGWGQIPLTATIFRESGYTLRAYTNWMQNFGEDYVFSQRFYIGTPSTDSWLVKSVATINRVANKNQLQVDIKLNRPDKLSSPVALKKVGVRIYDEWHHIYNETMQTGIDGSLKLSQILSDKADATKVRVQITSLEKDSWGKMLQVPLALKRDQNIDLQFLPEGGKLVTGLKSIVGFKALSENGKGIPVLGGIYDSNGNEVVSFATIHNGMGSFEFTPAAGQTYTAKILKPVTKSISLPKINAVGTVMHVDNPEQGDITISLAGLSNLNTDSACYVVGTSRGGIYYSQKVELGRPVIAIAKNMFPTGMARFTLFKGKIPINERAVFIDNNDQLDIKITPNKAAYNKRDSVGLEIEVKDKSGIPVQGSFSLAVTDDTQVQADSLGDFNIATSLLLNAELNGNIEGPGYYINRKNMQAWQALDNLMLTQGWTGYDWKDVFAPVKRQPRFSVEKELQITGVVSNITKKPLPNTQVIISSQKPSFIATATTDMNGRYVFRNLPAIDSGSFFIQASNDKGKPMSFGNVSVEKFKAPAVPETLKDQILPWYVNTDTTQVNYVKRKAESMKEDNFKLSGRVLNEVKIKAKKIIPEGYNPYGPGNSDLSFDAKDIKESAVTNLYELLLQKLPGLTIIHAKLSTYRGKKMHLPKLKFSDKLIHPGDLKIDGWAIPLDIDSEIPTIDEVIEALSEIKIASLKGMEVIYSPEYTARAISDDRNPGQVISIRAKDPYYESAMVVLTTVNGNGWYRDTKPATATYRPLPFMRPQQFYSPKYNVARTVIEPDYRATIHWEPNISTDANGKAKLYFYTSDITNGYTIKVSGTDATGGIGDGIFKIKPKAALQ